VVQGPAKGLDILAICSVVWNPLRVDSPELLRIHNPVAKLDHAKREIVAARFYEIPAEAVQQAALREGGPS